MALAAGLLTPTPLLAKAEFLWCHMTVWCQSKWNTEWITDRRDDWQRIVLSWQRCSVFHNSFKDSSHDTFAFSIFLSQNAHTQKNAATACIFHRDAVVLHTVCFIPSQKTDHISNMLFVIHIANNICFNTEDCISGISNHLKNNNKENTPDEQTPRAQTGKEEDVLRSFCRGHFYSWNTKLCSSQPGLC